MAEIGYADKAALIENASVPEKNKVSAANMNEIKNVVNANAKDLIYSTTEINTGETWIDGKPIYRKVFNFGTMPNTTTLDIQHNISNLGTTIKCYGMAVRSSDSRALTIPDSTPGAEISCGVTNTSVYVTTNNDRSSFNNSFIAIEYTKTTD